MTEQARQLVKESIKTIVDYPKQGILFRDVTSLLEVPEAFAASIRLIVERYRDHGFTKVVGTEARGFLFGTPVALALGVGFVPVRKPGKLPREVIAESYALEYGTDTLEMHIDAIVPGDKVLVIDDLLATGGTIEATAKLI
ncbi:MAG: adenine phosphoribosyltransferase, partial [Plesiomonas sp.]